MKNLLWVEFRRAFSSRLFFAALLIAVTLSLLHVALVAAPYAVSDLYEPIRQGVKGNYPISVYNAWIGTTGYSLYTTLYYVLLPLLACMPFSSSLSWDLETGYCSNLVIRTGFRNYYLSKMCATFFCAAFVCVFPLVLNLIGTAFFLPFLPPEQTTGTYPIFSNLLLADVYYESPMTYIAFYLFATALISGSIATLSLAITFLRKDWYIVVLSPFIVCVVLSFLFASSQITGLLPNQLVIPYQPYCIQGHSLAMMLAFPIGSLALFFIGTRRQEILK